MDLTTKNSKVYQHLHGDDFDLENDPGTILMNGSNSNGNQNGDFSRGQQSNNGFDHSIDLENGYDNDNFIFENERKKKFYDSKISYYVWRSRWFFSLLAGLVLFILLLVLLLKGEDQKNEEKENTPTPIPTVPSSGKWTRFPFRNETNRFHLEDFTDNAYSWAPRHIQNFEFYKFQDYAGDLVYFVNENGDLVLKKPELSDPAKVIIPKNMLQDIRNRNYNPVEFILSPSQNTLAIKVEVNRVWRHSTRSRYVLYDVKESLFLGDLFGNGNAIFVSSFEWSNRTDVELFSFVWNNNIFLGESSRKPIAGASSFKYWQISRDGVPEQVFNGVADWVYEEEVFSSEKATFWSNNGRYLCYLKFNDTMVQSYPNIFFQNAKNNFYYPDIKYFKYPNAGTPNPIVSVEILDWSQRRYLRVKNYAFVGENRIVTDFTWISDNQGPANEHGVLIFHEMDRAQGKCYRQMLDLNEESSDPLGEQYQVVNLNDPAQNLNISLYHVSSKSLLLNDVSSKGWIDTTGAILPVKLDKANSTTISPLYVALENDRTGYNHLALFSIDLLTYTYPLTGILGTAYEVTKVYGYDRARKVIWFQANAMGPFTRHVFFVNLDFFRMDLPVQSKEMLELLPGQLNEGTYDASFSPNFEYVTLIYKGPDVPSQKIMRLYGEKWELVLTVSSDLEVKLKSYKLPRIDYQMIPSIHVPGLELCTKIFYPPDFDVNQKYPVLIYAYGGPLSCITTKEYSILSWQTALASSENIIVATVDGRGTDGRGRDFRWAIFHDLGNKEVEDQQSLIAWLQGQSFVDSRLIAFHGWSYGGYLTAKMMELNSPILRIGLCVAPVYDWRAYDSVYTERYMGIYNNQDKDVLSRYEKSRVKVGDGSAFSSKGTHFLLMQGLADDNVHFWNTIMFEMDLSDRMAFAGIEQRVFGDSDHGMQRSSDRKESFTIMTQFLIESFQERSSTVAK